MARLQATTCANEISLQAAGETEMLRQQLDFRERSFMAWDGGGRRGG